MIFVMKMPGSTSPMRLACLAGVGSLMAGSAFLIITISRSAWSFVPLFVGLTIFYLAQRQLKLGVDKDLWTDAELELLRRRAAHPAWMALFLLGVAAFIACNIVTDFHRGSYLVWAMLFPLQTMLYLKTILKLSPPEGDGGLLKLQTANPIRSEHWGESR
jgi:O-antigen ligase